MDMTVDLLFIDFQRKFKEKLKWKKIEYEATLCALALLKEARELEVLLMKQSKTRLDYTLDALEEKVLSWNCLTKTDRSNLICDINMLSIN